MESKTIDRVIQIIDSKGISLNAFSHKIGVSNGYLAKQKKSGSNVGSHILEKIVTAMPDINSEWLLTGEGPMLKDELPATGAVAATGGVPLVGVEAVAGLGSATFSISEDDILDHYQVPDFKQVDFMLRLNGDSMAPTYNGGDVVGCLDIKDSRFIQWGRVYLLATRHQGLLVKRIRRGSSDATLSCVSDNAAYDPFEIDRTEITGMALVVGTIRLE